MVVGGVSEVWGYTTRYERSLTAVRATASFPGLHAWKQGYNLSWLKDIITLLVGEKLCRVI